MEITKIRKGNDIRLKIQLKFTDKDDFANIQSLRAIFVNTTLKQKVEEEFIKKNRFIGRFPIEPFVDEYQPNEYCINSTGYGKYRAFVYNQYNGFGVTPDWKKSMPIRDVDITEYYAPVESTVDSKVRIINFPAEHQLYEGVYQLVVQATIYDSGYKNSKRVVTVNYNNIFELVEDSEDATDKPVQIEIINTDPEEPLEDVYVISGVYGDNTISLRRNDNNIIDVDVSPITSWYEGD